MSPLQVPRNYTGIVTVCCLRDAFEPTFGSRDVTEPNLGRLVAVLVRPSFVFANVWGTRCHLRFWHVDTIIGGKC